MKEQTKTQQAGEKIRADQSQSPTESAEKHSTKVDFNSSFGMNYSCSRPVGVKLDVVQMCVRVCVLNIHKNIAWELIVAEKHKNLRCEGNRGPSKWLSCLRFSAASPWWSECATGWDPAQLQQQAHVHGITRHTLLWCVAKFCFFYLLSNFNSGDKNLWRSKHQFQCRLWFLI